MVLNIAYTVVGGGNRYDTSRVSFTMSSGLSRKMTMETGEFVGARAVSCNQQSNPARRLYIIKYCFFLLAPIPTW